VSDLSFMVVATAVVVAAAVSWVGEVVMVMVMGNGDGVSVGLRLEADRNMSCHGGVGVLGSLSFFVLFFFLVNLV
jgi:hypothetical protein